MNKRKSSLFPQKKLKTPDNPCKFKQETDTNVQHYKWKVTTYTLEKKVIWEGYAKLDWLI